jgi:hypothetical protein
MEISSIFELDGFYSAWLIIGKFDWFGKWEIQRGVKILIEFRKFQNLKDS